MGRLEPVLQVFAKPFSSFLIFVQVYQKNGQLKRILLVDNFDSFTYNLVHYLESHDCSVDVCYNTAIPTGVANKYDAVVLSPGPGLPEESGDLKVFVAEFLGEIPILGVCLGMQALAVQLGGTLYNQQVVKHGVQESIITKRGVLFSQDDSEFEVGLYHSWAVSKEGDYTITAESKNGTVMALENKSLRCYGVQFHPESILTPKGMEILENFLEEVAVETPISAE